MAMKRLCIFLIYDYDKVVDEYIGIVLDELRKSAEHLVIVCNFDKIRSGEEYLEGRYDQIFFRDNTGYDAGAYKDVLDNLITWEKAYEYDELLLTNDTYIAPLYPFEEMFDKMSRSQCDFWGITRHPKGEFKDGRQYPSHIQSYFLNFKRKVFHSKEFRDYWDAYKSSNDKMNTIYSFELGINIFLAENGYAGKAYMDLVPLDFADHYSMNPYSMRPYELIRDARILMIKKNILFFDNRGYVNALKALEFIEQNLDYDINIIKRYISRVETTKPGITVYDFNAMGRFIDSHDRIYIYGKGIWANIMTIYFQYRGWRMDGYLVTNMTAENEGALIFSETQIMRNDGVIIAQKYKEIGEKIYEILMDKCMPQQIFMPVYR